MSTKTKETSLNREEKGAEIKHESKNVGKRKEESGKLGILWKFLSKISIEPAVIIMNLAWTMYWVQTSNLYIEKTCKVGSFFFGNGTTFSSEVLRSYKILIFFSGAIDFPSPITRFWKIPSSGVWQSVQWNFSWGAGVRSDCRCQRWDGFQLDQTGILLFCLIWEFILLWHPSWQIHINLKHLQPDPLCHLRPLSWTLEWPSGKETFNPGSLHRLFSLLCRHVVQRLLLRRALCGVSLVWKYLGLVWILRYLPHRLLWIFGGHDLSRNKVLLD